MWEKTQKHWKNKKKVPEVKGISFLDLVCVYLLLMECRKKRYTYFFNAKEASALIICLVITNC